MSGPISRFSQRRAILSAFTLALLASGCAQAQVSSEKPATSQAAPAAAVTQSTPLRPLVNLPDSCL